MGKYDVGVMVSLDTDLIPALEFVHLFGTFTDGLPRPEVAAWGVAHHERRRLQVKDATIPCRWLTEKDYPAIRDLTAYADRS